MSNIHLPDHKTLQLAKQLLIDWEVVAFPTETVYWLWANALDPVAVAKIFKLKNRPSNNPLIVHLWHKRDISKYWIISNPIEKKIIEKLMPGPITLLLPKRDNIPAIVSPNAFVWLRIPSNQAALNFLQTCDLPIAAPSANISTKPSPTSAKMVYQYFWNKIPLIIDWWNCHVGIESTVIKVDHHSICKPMSGWDCEEFYKIDILRPGFVTKEDLEILFANHNNISVHYSSHQSNISPGNLYRHYSPRAHVEIIDCLTPDILKERLNIKIQWSAHIKLWLIITQECINLHKKILNEFKDYIHVFPRWSRNDLISCAQKLFDIYNICDKHDINYILIEHLQEVWLWYSIMNRVKKSTEK